MAHGPYSATFLLKDLTGPPVRGSHDVTKIPILHLTQGAHVRSMVMLFRVAFIILVIMRDGCVLVTMIKELICSALKCSCETTHVVGSTCKEG